MLFCARSALPPERRLHQGRGFRRLSPRHPGRRVGAEGCSLAPSHPWCLLLPQAFVPFGPHFSKVLVVGVGAQGRFSLGWHLGEGGQGEKGRPLLRGSRAVAGRSLVCRVGDSGASRPTVSPSPLLRFSCVFKVQSLRPPGQLAHEVTETIGNSF